MSTLEQPSTPSQSRAHVVLDAPSRVVVKVLLIAALFALGVNMVLELRSLLIQIAIAGFFAIAADPVVRRMQRKGISRGRAVLSVMLGAFLFVGLALAVFVPPLIEQGDRLIAATPEIVQDVRTSGLYREVDARVGLVDTLSEQAERLPSIVGDQIGTWFGVIASGLFGTITILFLTVFLLLGGGQVVHGTVRLVPKLAERRAWSIVQGAYLGIAAYVGGAIIIALLGGTSLAIMAFVLGLPYALPLGLWMMLLEIIPMIGATLGAIPAVIVAFVAGGTCRGDRDDHLRGVYQQVENIIIQPRVQGRAAALTPLVVFLAVLVGSHCSACLARCSPCQLRACCDLPAPGHRGAGQPHTGAACALL